MSRIKNDLVSCLKVNAEIFRKKKGELAKIEARIKRMDAERSKGFEIDGKERHTLETKKAALKREIADGVSAAKLAAESLIDSAINELRELDMPKGSDISEDAKLLKAGVKLSADEILFLMNKKENQNPSMNRLFKAYAEENGFLEPSVENQSIREGFISSIYSRHDEEIKEMEDEKHALDYAVRWLDKDNGDAVIDKMFGDHGNIEVW